jgi:ribonuclease HI
MPWIEAVLRGQRVFARANADGSFFNEGGRVEIRYGVKDPRAYRASVGNLQVKPGSPVISDESGPPGEGAPATDDRRGAAKTSRSRRSAPQPEPLAADGWTAYADGACSGNPGPAGCGIVLVSPDGKMHEGFAYIGVATNNVAELTGILRALQWAPGSARAITVHTDSQYAIGVLQKGWKAKVNQELVQTAKEEVAARRARLVYVPGHSGVVLNERADALARLAVETRTSRAVEVADE